MAAVPFMPLYVADYMADAAHLSTLEHGAYLLLIMAYWQRGEALPDDDKKLARIVGLQGANWRKVSPVLREFFVTENGKLIHHRIERELQHLRDKSLKNRKGGLARAKQMQSERLADAQRTVSHADTDTDTHAISVTKVTGELPSPDKVFWDNAKAYLGKSKAGMIGKWVRNYGKDATAKAITAAQIERAVDPVPYIERVLRRRSRDDEELPIC